jgi:uncharacterized protein
MEKFIHRAFIDSFFKRFVPSKVVVLLGARRVGKTSFLQWLINNDLKHDNILSIDGEDIVSTEILKERSFENYKRLIGNNSVLIIDEAQKIPEIGVVIKFFVDKFPHLRIIATGSSMFDLANKLGEPLTGRKFTIQIHPFSQLELSQDENLIQTRSLLETRLIYGSYPETIYKSYEDKEIYLKELVNSYLLKDILEFNGVKNASKMFDILRLIAFQIGSEVSLDEVSNNVGIARNTVEKYLDLLSKVFVVFKLNGFSKNLRNEITKTSRWYFYDNGIRNALISNFNQLYLRNDAGQLWENYIISERIKFQNYRGLVSNNYFWRTYDQAEIDFVEERNAKLYAYEIKWNPKKNVKVPVAWQKAYPESEFKLINQDNYLDWIT